MTDQKVIGGEYCIEHNVTNEISVGEQYPRYSLGRTCLDIILENIYFESLGAILLPDYICISVSATVLKKGIKIYHYHVDGFFQPDYDSIKLNIGLCDSILLVSYFGMVDIDGMAFSIRRDYPEIKIIIDDVQGFYETEKHTTYDYCFNSYRKWFPVPDGAEIITDNDRLISGRLSKNPQYAYYKAAGNILKNYRDYIGDDVALELLDKGEAIMDDEYSYECSDISKALIGDIDFQMVAQVRKNNAEVLHKGLEKLKIPHLYCGDKVPMFIPIQISNRDAVRKKMFENSIYTPIHWPCLDEIAQGKNALYNTELSLICDQRYDEEDMEKELEVLKNAI
ncbi:hypothetical protein [Butyrivibrio sp. AE2032]|uniref:hypothetical protein n=1 Tax=Butyrivibrio sp. AE2032 TaxID=1458463 RepID=UPI000554B1C8|nr:hypothetical protein [Butyrivibrio sp. AE2032]